MIEQNTRILNYYTTQSPFTNPKEYSYLFNDLPESIPQLVEIVHGIMIHRDATDLYNYNLPEGRKLESEIRYVSKILKRVTELNDSELKVTRPPEKRFAGTCRDFAIMLCAVLRYKNIPARLRCGFAAYFIPERYEDHWLCEYWSNGNNRWVLVDSEIDKIIQKAYKIQFNPLDVPQDQFLVAGKAWRMCRTNKINPDKFGVDIINIKGMWFIRSNVIRDLAALDKVEVLPWDYWGLSDKEFESLSEDELKLIDYLAELTTDNKLFNEMRSIYKKDERLRVPQVIKSYTTFAGIQMVNLNLS